MTEAEWLTATDPKSMLTFLNKEKLNTSKQGRRRLRLFGCACTLRIQCYLTERGRKWLDLGEQLADNLVNLKSLKDDDFGPCDGQRTDHQADFAAYITVCRNVMTAATGAAASGASAVETEAWHCNTDPTAAKATEHAAQCGLIRDIFGNPFRPVTLSPSWLTSTVLTLARGIYDAKAFDRLPILADALQDAGCDNDDILNHLREPGEHCRGCWALDLLLGKR